MPTAPTGPLFGSPAGSDPLIPGINPATYSFNRDIVAIYEKSNDFLEEVLHSNSANVAQIMPADAARITARIDDIRKFVNLYVVTEPILDMVKTGQQAKFFTPGPNIVEVENTTLQYLIGQVTDFRDEVANSQSTRLPNNLMKFDTVRVLAMLDKMDKLMGYDSTAQPLDSPASTPDELMVSRGNVGP